MLSHQLFLKWVSRQNKTVEPIPNGWKYSQADQFNFNQNTTKNIEKI